MHSIDGLDSTRLHESPDRLDLSIVRGTTAFSSFRVKGRQNTMRETRHGGYVFSRAGLGAGFPSEAVMVYIQNSQAR